MHIYPATVSSFPALVEELVDDPLTCSMPSLLHISLLFSSPFLPFLLSRSSPVSPHLLSPSCSSVFDPRPDLRLPPSAGKFSSAPFINTNLPGRLSRIARGSSSLLFEQPAR